MITRTDPVIQKCLILGFVLEIPVIPGGITPPKGYG